MILTGTVGVRRIKPVWCYSAHRRHQIESSWINPGTTRCETGKQTPETWQGLEHKT